MDDQLRSWLVFNLPIATCRSRGTNLRVQQEYDHSQLHTTHGRLGQLDRVHVYTTFYTHAESMCFFCSPRPLSELLNVRSTSSISPRWTPQSAWQHSASMRQALSSIPAPSVPSSCAQSMLRARCCRSSSRLQRSLRACRRSRRRPLLPPRPPLQGCMSNLPKPCADYKPMHRSSERSSGRRKRCSIG